MIVENAGRSVDRRVKLSSLTVKSHASVTKETRIRGYQATETGATYLVVHHQDNLFL